MDTKKDNVDYNIEDESCMGEEEEVDVDEVPSSAVAPLSVSSSASAPASSVSSSSGKKAKEFEAKETKKKKRTFRFKKAPDAPKRFKSAYILFSTEKHKEIKQKLIEKGALEKTTEIAKLVSEAWKEISPQERSFWESKADRDKARYKAEKLLYKGPWKISAAGRARKDPSAPKRPMSAYFAFSNERRVMMKKQNPEATNGELSRLLSESWKEAPPSVREPYEVQEAKQRRKYKIDMAKWTEKATREKKLQRDEREAMALKVADLQHARVEQQAMDLESERAGLNGNGIAGTEQEQEKHQGTQLNLEGSVALPPPSEAPTPAAHAPFVAVLPSHQHPAVALTFQLSQPSSCTISLNMHLNNGNPNTSVPSVQDARSIAAGILEAIVRNSDPNTGLQLKNALTLAAQMIQQQPQPQPQPQSQPQHQLQPQQQQQNQILVQLIAALAAFHQMQQGGGGSVVHVPAAQVIQQPQEQTQQHIHDQAQQKIQQVLVEAKRQIQQIQTQAQQQFQGEAQKQLQQIQAPTQQLQQTQTQQMQQIQQFPELHYQLPSPPRTS